MSIAVVVAAHSPAIGRSALTHARAERGDRDGQNRGPVGARHAGMDEHRRQPRRCGGDAEPGTGGERAAPDRCEAGRSDEVDREDRGPDHDHGSGAGDVVPADAGDEHQRRRGDERRAGGAHEPRGPARGDRAEAARAPRDGGEERQHRERLEADRGDRDAGGQHRRADDDHRRR